MGSSLRLSVVLAAGAFTFMLQAACARSPKDDLGPDAFLAPGTPEPLIACIDTECPKPWATCGGRGSCATDTSRDIKNCGACGNECPQPQKSLHGTSLCTVGVCAFACDPYFADCNHDVADGCEVDVESDLQNCGGCGIACKAGDICWRGACGCPPGFSDCDGECKNLQADDSACGGCDSACHPPSNDDPAWTCGPGVQPPNTTWGCAAGGCELTCEPPYTACGGDLCAHGCEINLNRDAQNCGACGHACEANQECVNGECLCPPGLTRCFDRCLDANVDVDNCGECGNTCLGASDSTANGGPTCNGGVCGYVCYPGFANCNENISDGCEIDLGTDQHHCGSCGAQCDVAQGQPCVLGRCLTKPCGPVEATK